jgi:hypothetical protein
MLSLSLPPLQDSGKGVPEPYWALGHANQGCARGGGDPPDPEQLARSASVFARFNGIPAR